MNVNTHTKGLEQILTRLYKSKKYDFIKKNEEYFFEETGYGEIDVYAITPDMKRLFIFEYKSFDTSKAENKAENQLGRAEKFLRACFKPKMVYKYYVSGKKPVYRRVK